MGFAIMRRPVSALRSARADRFVAGLALLWLAAGGCRVSGAKRSEPPTQVDRLIDTYAPLQSGRFAVIADFENPAQMELVQLVSVSPKARCVRDRKHGRKKTGRTCLKFTSGSSRDAVIFNNTNVTRWYLRRDWHEYDTLLVNVNAPDEDLRLTVSITAGSPQHRHIVESDQALGKGWNTLSWDLAEVGEHIALDDIREIRLSVSSPSKPVTLYLDDIILTEDRRDVWGDSQAAGGDMYVQRVGQRWNIGAGGRFELTFAHGQIVGWYNLASDPHRLRNLVAGTTLGPSPVLLESDGESSSGFSGSGPAVAVSFQIVEMNEVRVTVESLWRFVGDRDAPPDKQPFQRWKYVIYPTGQIFVTAQDTRWSASRADQEVGLAVTLASDPGDVREIHATDEASGRSSRLVPYAVVRKQAADTLLLYLLSEQADASSPTRIMEQLDPARRRTSLVAVTDSREGPISSWQCQLWLTSAHEVSDEQARLRAIDYRDPPTPRMELGFAARSEAGASADGYHRALGCYDIKPDKGRVRLVLDGTKQAFYSPVFQVTGPPQTQAWVYVNHLIHRAFHQDEHGRLLFQLPGTVDSRTVVEVLFRRKNQAVRSN